MKGKLLSAKGQISFVFIALLLMGIGLNSCKEEEMNEVSGFVIGYPELETLDNVEVQLDVKKATQGSYATSWENLGTTTTDSDGKFDFSFENIRAYEYRLIISRENYRTKTILFEPKDYVSTYDFQETMIKDASLEITIRNMIFPMNPSDEIRIRVSDYPVECTDCSGSDFITLYGAIDTVLTYMVAGDDEVLIEYTIDKDGSEYFRSTQYMHPNQTNTKTIHF